MADNHSRLIKNSKSLPCQRCKGVHEFITRLSDDEICDTPVAFSLEKALRLANLKADGEESVIRVPKRMVVILDDSARKLPHNDGHVPLAQFTVTERFA